MSTTDDHLPAPAEAGKSPARGWSRPPFQLNNLAALRHGSNSERTVAPMAAAFEQAVLDQAAADPTYGHLQTPIFAPAVKAWARTEARIELLATWIDDQATADRPGMLADDGTVRDPAAELRRLEAQAVRHRESLGVTPAAFARLKRDAGSALVSLDLAQLLAGVAAEPPPKTTGTTTEEPSP